MSALAPQDYTPQITQSHVAAASAMAPPEIDAKLVAANLPTYTAQEKVADKREVALGFDQGAVKELAANFADGGLPVPMAGPLGVVASLFTRDFYSKRELAELTEKYQDLIAERLGMDAADVTEEHLKTCAMQDQGLASALLAVARKRESHVTSNAGALAAMTAGAAAGSVVPVVGTLIGGLAGFMGGEAVSKYMLDVTDASNPQACLEAIEKKQAEKQYITVQDVFALKLAQHPKIREQVIERHGDNFNMLDEKTRAEVMHGLPKLAQAAARDSVLCNFPDSDVRRLMFGDMAPPAANLNSAPLVANTNAAPTQWAARIEGERSGMPNAQQGVGFAEAILRGREAFADQQPQV